jgi:hypothetical protein
MTATCGIDFREASSFIEIAEIGGVSIPFATPELLLRTKQPIAKTTLLIASFFIAKSLNKVKKVERICSDGLEPRTK